VAASEQARSGAPWWRFSSQTGLRRTGLIAMASVGLVASLATVSVVAVSAVTALKGPVTSVPPAAPTGGGRWIVPHSQLGAPVVPIAGGAKPGSGSLNGVSCATTSFCVAVGASANLGGVASTSTDGGATWKQGAMAAGEPVLNAVDCSSTSNCVAVGQGAAVRSIDGGVTWISTSLPTANTTLLGVSCATTTSCVSVGVAPGDHGPLSGELLFSTDGGATWSAAAVPAAAGAQGSVACPTSTLCVSVGATILVSGDGGRSWTERAALGGTGVLRSVSCASATRCVAIGPNPSGAQDLQAAAFEVLTTDGGATWTAVGVPPASASLQTISCAGGTCEAAGASYQGATALFLTTIDGGITWTNDLTLAASLDAVSGVSCASPTSCVLVGQSSSGPVAIVTSGGVVSGTTKVASLVRHQRTSSK
jgi:hypothetical protein